VQHAEPTILTIVGITGDLSRRKLLPSLYHLEQDNLLPESFKIIGTTRKEINSEQFFEEIKQSIIESDSECEEPTLRRLFGKLTVETIDMSDSEHYGKLAELLKQSEQENGVCSVHLFYLAIPPKVLPRVVDLIGHAEVHRCSHGKDGRILIEKPFGRDLASANELSEVIKSHFKEEQIYRIDHYLAKETVQNILHFRFNNPIIRDIWNSDYIDSIQITAAEAIGIEGRANFYEEAGALRDMVQSHLLQLLALTTMERPKELNAQEVRSKREEVLKDLKPITLEEVDKLVVRGQYEAYRKEVGNDQSNVETFVALKATIDSDRWRDVSIYLRTGKNLKYKATEITLVYRNKEADSGDDINLLTIRVQPNEGIALRLRAKKPGLENERQNIVMDYCYGRAEDKIKHSAYEKLLIDAMRGDQMLFPTTEEVVNNWKYLDPVIKHWQSSDKAPSTYPANSWGPEAAMAMLADEHDAWMQQDNSVCRPN